MKQIPLRFLLLTLIYILTANAIFSLPSNKNKKIAIIGSGIGGASAAYYLLKENQNISVDIFEKNKRVGGRVYSELIEGEAMDLGASFFIKENQLLYSIIQDLNIPYYSAKDHSQPLAFFRNKDILFKSTGWTYIDLIKLVWKYGLSPFRMYFSLKRNLHKFLTVYDNLSQKKIYTDLDQFLTSIQLKHLLHMTIEDLLLNENVSQSYIDDIISGMIAGIYNQHKEINAFAGFITLAGVNYTPYKITGGNNKLIEKIVENLNNTYTHTERFVVKFTEVTQIIKNGQNKFELYHNNNTLIGEYDIVIVACPLEKSGIKFTNISIVESDKLPNKFQPNHKSFISGQINPGYFNNEDADNKDFMYSMISVNKTLSYDFTEFIAKRVKNGIVYHIQSDREVDFSDIKEKGFIQGDYNKVFEYHWDYAYPKLDIVDINQKLPSFKLSNNLYHINAIELAGSCMEMSIISARNIVNMIESESINEDIKRDTNADL